MNLHICGCRTALTSIQCDYKIGGIIQQRVYHREVQDVNDLMQRLDDMWAGVEHSITDDAIEQWRRRLLACI